MAKEDPKYLTWLREQSCCACNRAAPSEAHHATGAGMGLRSDDREAMPLCSECHRDLHNHTGRFKNMSKEAKKDWQKTRATIWRLAYECSP
jgi:hypothetical protein